MKLPPKAESVTVKGAPDGFSPPNAYEPQVVPGGHTRLLVSAPADRLAEVHRALLSVLDPPFRVLYRQLTDRASGQLPKPRDWIAAEISAERLAAALEQAAPLIYHDGRHQLWIRGLGPEQVVLEEIGTLFAYPDDPAYRDALDAAGLAMGKHPNMAERDYVKVNFLADADALERGFFSALGMTRWG